LVPHPAPPAQRDHPRRPRRHEAAWGRHSLLLWLGSWLALQQKHSRLVVDDMSSSSSI